MPLTFTNPFKRNNLQTNSDVREQTGAVQPKSKRGKKRIDYPAIQSPTITDIIAVAEFYECEGNICINGNQIKVTMGQNDRERLDKYCSLFGGKVYGPYTNMAGNDTYQHVIIRERALGFMFTIFTFLTRSRRDQFKSVLDGKPQRRYQQKTINDTEISEAFIRRNIERNAKISNKTVKGSMRLFGVKK